MTAIASPALSLLQSLNASGSSPNLLGILYGSGQTGPGASGDPVAAMVRAEANEAKQVASQKKDPATKRDIDRFLAAVAKAKDLKSLLADPAARKVLLTANGLGDKADYPALATKALMSDPAKSGNLASTLSDKRWLQMVKTFDFANKGLSVLKQQATLDSISKAYAEVQWRQSLDASTPGLSAALDFRQRAATVTSVDQILGDANLRKVVTTALGIPQQIAFQPLEAQERAITDRLDLSKLKDAKFVEQFARRFLLTNASASRATSAQPGAGLLV